MEAKTQSRNIWLDIFKYFLCYLVICIHLVGETYSHFPLYRLAVPMFFLISGYFSNFDDNKEEKSRKVIKRTLKYLVVGFVFYIIFDFIMCFVDGKGVGYYFTTLFYNDIFLNLVVLNTPITYTGAQLWFLIALFFVTVVHWLLVKYNKEKLYYIIVPVCLALFFFFSSYMYIFQETDMPIRYVRNAWLFGLPVFGLGYLISKIDFHKKSYFRYIYLVLGILFFILQIYEDRFLRFLSNDAPLNCEMYISSLISAICFLQFFMSIKHCYSKKYYDIVGKNGAFYVYILHMAVAVVVSKFWSFNNLLVKSLVVLIISFSIYLLCYHISKLWKRYRNNKKLKTDNV